MILFVTVGTSALYNPGIGGESTEGRQLRAAVDEYRESPDVLKPSMATRNRLWERLVEAHRVFFRSDAEHQADPRNWRETSAELLSTRVLLKKRQREGDPPPSRIILLASETPDGILAGEVCLDLMKTMFRPIDCKGLVIVKGLNTEFIDTTEKLWEAMEPELRRAEGAVQVNMTGGYKGTIPSLTTLAATYGWRLFYQHESLHEIVELSFVVEGGAVRIVENPWSSR